MFNFIREMKEALQEGLDEGNKAVAQEQSAAQAAKQASREAWKTTLLTFAIGHKRILLWAILLFIFSIIGLPVNTRAQAVVGDAANYSAAQMTYTTNNTLRSSAFNSELDPISGRTSIFQVHAGPNSLEWGAGLTRILAPTSLDTIREPLLSAQTVQLEQHQYLPIVLLPIFSQAQLEALANSRVTWDEKSAEAEGNYIYSSEFQSWVGFGSTTTIHVSGDVVTKRVYESYDADGQPSDAYEEDADSLGVNPMGASVSTIDELYDQCEEILKTKEPESFTIYFELFDNNILSHCLFRDNNCADDCWQGVSIDTLSFTE